MFAEFSPTQCYRIGSQIFPLSTPRSDDLDFEVLAQKLEITGAFKWLYTHSSW